MGLPGGTRRKVEKKGFETLLLSYVLCFSAQGASSTPWLSRK